MLVSAGYEQLAREVLNQSKAELSQGIAKEWDFYASGRYQLYTSICDINDDVYRKEIADIALPVAEKLGLRVSEIILFEGELNG